jgi:cytoskeletal protein CcmA (bactofilin family)
MLFKKKDQEEEGEFIGEAKVMDGSEEITEVRGASINATAEEPELVAPSAIIGQSILVKGDVSGDEDLIVEGRIEGTVSLLKSRLTVGANGNVRATVNVKTLNIEGNIEGDVTAGENVVLTSSGKMQGNIKAPRITLQDGCKFKGTIDMEMEPSAVVTDLKQPFSSASHKPNPDQAI